MIYLSKIQRAIKFATKTHEIYQKQKRKGKDVAYISHPLTVGIILSRAGAEEDVVCAGILHDTIEDSTEEKKVSYEMLKDRFGKAVADGVMSVTETERNLPWKERKRIALEHIANFSENSLLIKSADVISNVAELVDDHYRYGDIVFERFNAEKNDVLKNQLKVIDVILKKWPDNPLTADLVFLSKELNKMKQPKD